MCALTYTVTRVPEVLGLEVLSVLIAAMHNHKSLKFLFHRDL